MCREVERATLCVYLVLTYLAILSKIGTPMQQILRLLQLVMFERGDLKSLFIPSKIEAYDNWRSFKNYGQQEPDTNLFQTNLLIISLLFNVSL